MSLIDLLRAPWAVLPDRLDEYQAIYATHLRGEKIDIKAIEARLGRPLASEQQDYTVRDGGIAVLNINGAISPKANMFTQISGGASAQALIKQMESMAADGRVKGAVLAWDSPGGSVQGIPALAAANRALAEVKPTVSVSDGLMASAAYWAGSGSNAIYASGETDTIGSIGVVARHTYDPRATGTTTEVVAGKYKRITSDSQPLSKEGLAYMQAQVDEIYSVFLEAVAQNRRVSVEDVLANMADGRVFIGRQAKAAGLIDGFATVDQMVEQMATNPAKFASRKKAVFALGGPPAIGAQSSEVQPGAADLAPPAAAQAAAIPEAGPVPPAASTTNPTEADMTPQEAAAKFAAENPQAAAALRSDGATAEQARIAAVRAQSLPGHEKLIEALAADGKTTGPEAAMAVLAAEKTRVAAAASSRMSEAPAPIAMADDAPSTNQPPKQPQRVPNAEAAYAALNKRPAH